MKKCLKEACTIAIEAGKFKMVWVNDPKQIKQVPVMISGTDKGYSQRLKQFLVIRMCHKEGGW
jgi:hypothetical protein